MKLVGLNWSSETNKFQETPIDIVDNTYLEADVDNGVAINYPDGSITFVGRILVKLEGKEVDLDLEKEIDAYIDLEAQKIQEAPFISVENAAKYFFELGMAVSNKAQKGE